MPERFRVLTINGENVRTLTQEEVVKIVKGCDKITMVLKKGTKGFAQYEKQAPKYVLASTHLQCSCIWRS